MTTEPTTDKLINRVIDLSIECGSAKLNFALGTLIGNIKAMQQENERLRQALSMIACRPFGGKIEDYKFSSMLQDWAKEALTTEPPLFPRGQDIPITHGSCQSNLKGEVIYSTEPKETV